MMASLDVKSGISSRLEILRNQMVRLGMSYDNLLHPDVLSCSMKVDQLVLEYYAADRTQ